MFDPRRDLLTIATGRRFDDTPVPAARLRTFTFAGAAAPAASTI